jgi:hypothetical protein
MSSHFLILVNRRNLTLLNVEFNLNVSSIVQVSSEVHWAADNLQSVSHVRRNQQLARNNLQHWEDFEAKHLGTDCHQLFLVVILLGYFVFLVL